MKHLTTDQLSALKKGSYPPDEQERIWSHIEGCERCRQQLASRESGSSHPVYTDETAVLSHDGSDPSRTGADARLERVKIPGYKIVSEIQRGGQGVVYKAIQKATNRAVALKVLASGVFAGEKELRRFEREIDIAAGLDHPYIVTIYDSGEVEGTRFCAMQYVRGVPLDDHVREQGLSLREKLDLFLKVCEGAQYAHQRGVIHRDLKPSNILISESGVPHILDFGLARATGLVGTRGVTVTGEVVGTLAYASPEQVSGDPHKVDVRSDVYSLGVLLYEMLTDSSPYDVEAEVLQVLKNIAEEDPVPPSKIDPAIPDDVETIILKALAKDPDRRYSSVEAMARDIESFFKGEPIGAKKDSTFYVFRKTVYRHRWAVSFGLLLLIVLVSAGGVLAVQASRLAVQRDRARLAETRANLGRDVAEEARLAEEAQRRVAERRAYIATLAAAEASLQTSALTETQGLLDSADPAYRGWEWSFLRHRCDSSAESIRAGLNDEGLVSSPDGTWIGGVDDQGRIRVWEAGTGRLLVDIEDPDAEGVLEGTVAIHTDPWTIGYPVRGDAFRIRNLATRRTVTDLEIGADLQRPTFSPDGELLAAGKKSDSTWIYTWSVRTGDLLSRYDLGANPGGTIFSPDAERLFSVTWDGRIKVWKVHTGRELGELVGHDSMVWRLVFHPSGSTLYSAGLDGTVRVWDVVAMKPVTVLRGHRDSINGIAVSPDGTMLASTSLDGSVRIWDTASYEPRSLSYGGCIPAAGVAFIGGGRRLSIICRDSGDLRLWDVGRSSDMRVATSRSRPITLAYDPTGLHIATGSTDGAIRIRDGSTGELLKLIQAHDLARITDIAFSPDGRSIATTCRDSTVMWTDVDTEESTLLIQDSRPGCGVVAFLDERRLAIGCDDGVVRVHEPSGDASRLGPELGSPVTALALAPDAEHLAVGGEGLLAIWNLDTNRSEQQVATGADLISALAWAPDGKLLVAGDAGGRVHEIEVREGHLIRSFEAHASRVKSVSMLPDGSRYATAAHDGFIRLWGPEFDRALLRLRDGGGWVTDAAFSPDGKRLASLSWDHLLVIRDRGDEQD